MICFGARTDTGKKREYNDDCVVAEEDSCFFAVADGIGQISYGGFTAKKVCELMKWEAAEIMETYRGNHDTEAAAEAFRTAVSNISNRIFSEGNEPELYRYGTTFVGAMIFDRQIAIVNIGDSRAYVRKKGQAELIQITEDQNLAVDASKKGYMTYSQAVEIGLASRLLNFVGVSAETKTDLFLVDRDQTDILLLCSDGLTGMVADEKISQYISSVTSPETVCEGLIDMANMRGGKDNISVVCVRFS